MLLCITTITIFISMKWLLVACRPLAANLGGGDGGGGDHGHAIVCIVWLSHQLVYPINGMDLFLFFSVGEIFLAHLAPRTRKLKEREWNSICIYFVIHFYCNFTYIFHIVRVDEQQNASL